MAPLQALLSTSEGSTRDRENVAFYKSNINMHVAKKTMLTMPMREQCKLGSLPASDPLVSTTVVPFLRGHLTLHPGQCSAFPEATRSLHPGQCSTSPWRYLIVLLYYGTYRDGCSTFISAVLLSLITKNILPQTALPIGMMKGRTLPL